MKPVQNINIRETVPLITPGELKARFPSNESANRTVSDGRESIRNILAKQDSRLMLIVGPCSIHDPKAALEYAERLNELRVKFQERLLIVMRVYFEKPRTTVGWKGLIADPGLNGTNNISEGLGVARELLLRICSLGLPTATEFLDPIVPQYLSDLISWTAIGARTTESQTHRMMASGLSMPVGFKNNTDGSLQVAIDAMEAARHPHAFLGIDEDGRTCVVNTVGNSWGHVVLRGGRKRPNYDVESIQAARQTLQKANLEPALLVDCSHANSGKKHERQEVVWNNVLDQKVKGDDAIIGMLLESNLFAGNQKIPENAAELAYGISVTDECIGWENTAKLLSVAFEQHQPGRKSANSLL